MLDEHGGGGGGGPATPVGPKGEPAVGTGAAVAGGAGAGAGGGDGPAVMMPDEVEDDGDGPLPPGWTEHFDEETGAWPKTLSWNRCSHAVPLMKTGPRPFPGTAVLMLCL